MSTKLFAVKVDVLMIISAKDQREAASLARLNHVYTPRRSIISVQSKEIENIGQLPAGFSGDDEPTNSIGEKIKNYF